MLNSSSIRNNPLSGKFNVVYALLFLIFRPPLPLATAILVTEKAQQIPVSMPHCNKLNESVRKANVWSSKVNFFKKHVVRTLFVPRKQLPLMLLFVLRNQSTCFKVDEFAICRKIVSFYSGIQGSLFISNQPRLFVVEC